ncbi:Peptidoglycan-associated lipoprotein precursor [Candidatus Gullanella endobia]|uniref:Peptidoglycan-associated lipoprotein n=1 Tax=Candidatus Gullanella endobia TaxID=1070130 RepID=A0A143WRC9_9ENTR|nr:peptidoglycan-associated lipoprotein Pal [Candidatus Gullanella endobia]CUX96356.1 Peptidoglycan-associated lipoprotein precursor [Candidatus Gullanella endobia]
MKLNKIMKGLILTIPIVVITACSFYKNANNSNEAAIIDNTSNNINISSHSVHSDNQARLQIQDLHCNNIIYFNLNEHNIRSEFVHVLDIHANFLCNNPKNKVIIEGHTDALGTPEYNIALGERRANAVKMYLHNKGVSTDQIDVISYGKEKPAVLGHNKLAYAKNRRTVLIY